MAVTKFAVASATLSVGGTVNTALKDVQLRGRAPIRTAHAIEDGHPEKYANWVEFSGSGTVYCDATTENPWFAQVGDTVAIICTSQKSATPADVLNGSCIVTEAGDVQRDGDWEMQNISFESAEAPTTPA